MYIIYRLTFGVDVYLPPKSFNPPVFAGRGDGMGKA